MDKVLPTLNKRPDRIIPAARNAAAPTPDPETIRTRAYDIYVQRVATGRFGDADSDWQQAERELTEEAPISVQANKTGRA